MLNILALYVTWPALVLNGLVVLQALFAYHDGFFWPGQTKQRLGRRISFYVQHPGMWGDLLYLSALAAAIFEANQHHWSTRSTAVSFGISAVVSGVMVFQWTLAGNDMDDAFSKNRRPTACAWTHALYMFVVIPQLVQFFWFTPVETTTSSLRTVAALLLMIHIIVGVLLPGRITDGKISRDGWITAIVAWVIILVSWLHPYFF